MQKLSDCVQKEVETGLPLYYYYHNRYYYIFILERVRGGLLINVFFATYFIFQVGAVLTTRLFCVFWFNVLCFVLWRA